MNLLAINKKNNNNKKKIQWILDEIFFNETGFKHH